MTTTTWATFSPQECPAACRGVTLLQIDGGDINAAFATLFYLYVVNGVLYAWHKNYVPRIAFSPAKTRRTLRGVRWEDFFEPYCPHCVGPLVSKDFWFPQVHTRFKWPVRAWYYQKCPCGRRRRRACSDEDRKVLCPEGYDEDLYATWRRKGHEVVRRVHRPLPAIRRDAEDAWHEFRRNATGPTLAVHARGTDKKHGRRTIAASEFVLVIRSFLRTFGDSAAAVYLASEDASLAETIAAASPRVYVRPIATRSTGGVANFARHRDHQRKVARDVLVDILLMAKCDYFLHAASAVAEAVIYTNINLHNNSVNLEYIPRLRQTFPWASHPQARSPGGSNNRTTRRSNPGGK